MSAYAVVGLLAGGGLLVGAGVLVGRWSARREGGGDLGTPTEVATFHALHSASLAAPPLRAGLTEDTARKAARRLRSLLGTPALCLTDRDAVLAWDGSGDHHREQVMERAAQVLATGRGQAFRIACPDDGCASAVGGGRPADGGRRHARHAGRLRLAGVGCAGQGDRRGGPLGVGAVGTRRARPLAYGADRGGDPGPARPDLPALHLQLPRRDRLVRPHRSGPGPRTAAGVRRLHPLLVPPAR